MSVQSYSTTVAVSVLLSVTSAGAKASYTTFDAGVVTGINSASAVTGWRTDGDSFVRTVDGTVTTFAVPGASATEALQINDEGEIAGSYTDSSGKVHGFVRAIDGAFTTFDVPKASDTLASAINNRGTVAGRYYDDAGSHGFVRAASGRVKTFDIQGAAGIIPVCINDKGTISGNAAAHGFVRASDGTITTFDVPGANGGTFAGCINVKGTVIGTYFNGNGDGQHGFVRIADGTITTFDGQNCDIAPVGINRKGVIAGFCEDRENPKHFLGFVRHPDGSINEFHVPDDGPHTMPVGINDSGVIAGTARGYSFLRFP